MGFFFGGGGLGDNSCDVQGKMHVFFDTTLRNKIMGRGLVGMCLQVDPLFEWFTIPRS